MSASEVLRFWGEPRGKGWIHLSLQWTYGAKGHDEKYAIFDDALGAREAEMHCSAIQGWTLVGESGLRIQRGDARADVMRRLEGTRYEIYNEDATFQRIVVTVPCGLVGINVRDGHVDSVAVYHWNRYIDRGQVL